MGLEPTYNSFADCPVTFPGTETLIGPRMPTQGLSDTARYLKCTYGSRTHHPGIVGVASGIRTHKQKGLSFLGKPIPVIATNFGMPPGIRTPTTMFLRHMTPAVGLVALKLVDVLGLEPRNFSF